jgi:hypothetical protein
MGLIKPPWIDEKFFQSVPFNYCDHFGDKEELGLMCLICKEDIEREEKYKMEGKDPNAWENIAGELHKNFVKRMMMLSRMADEMGIDLENIPDEEEIKPDFNSYPISKVIETYSKLVRKTIHQLSEVPIETNIHLVTEALDALEHSEHYIIAKTHRALFSRWEDKGSKGKEYYSFDAETSAFLAYVAIERNSRALYRLAHHKPLLELRNYHLNMVAKSLDVMEELQDEFLTR